MIKGVRTIILGAFWAAPWAGAVLSDMGADVLRLESRTKLCGYRTMGYPFAGNTPSVNRSAFNFYNRGLKSFTLDLNQIKAREIFKQLIKITDIVISNFPPRVLPKWGLDYAGLKEIKSDIIFVSLTGFGTTGPDKDYLSFASVAMSLGGFTASFGYPDAAPAIQGTHIADPLGGMYGTICALSALYHRMKTGEGQFIDFSNSEAMAAVIPEIMIEYSMNNRIRPRMGNRDDIMAPHGVYKSKGEDKWVAIAISTDEEWKAFCRIMGNPKWCNEKKFSDQYSRWQNQDELNELINKWTQNLTHYEVMQKLQDAKIAAGPSFNVEELINDRHIKKRKVFIEQNHREAGMTIVFRSPWAAAKTSKNNPSPCLGEHNEYVFNHLLGISREDIEKLINEKVIY